MIFCVQFAQKYEKQVTCILEHQHMMPSTILFSKHRAQVRPLFIFHLNVVCDSF